MIPVHEATMLLNRNSNEKKRNHIVNNEPELMDRSSFINYYYSIVCVLFKRISIIWCTYFVLLLLLFFLTKFHRKEDKM